MNDEELYLEATKEVEGENKNPGLWAKVMALSEGDKEKAKYKYIKLRVDQLTNERKNAAPKFTKKSVDEFDLKYMPVAEFSKIKSIPEAKVIQMIRDGFYMGQIKDEEWFVSRDEIGTENSSTRKATLSPRQSATTQEYIPAEQFAEYKGFPVEKVINMIREGFYKGQIVDEKWYVAYSEIEESDKLQTSDNLTWSTVWKWVAILYAISLLGFFIKASAQMGGPAFQNIWQFFAVVSLPAIHMFWFGVLGIIYLAAKQFKIEHAGNFLSILAWIYVIFVAFRLISGRPI